MIDGLIHMQTYQQLIPLLLFIGGIVLGWFLRGKTNENVSEI